MAKPYKKAKYYRAFKQKRLFEKCQFCKEKSKPDYKDVGKLKGYIKETGKITSRKVNGNCAKHQRRLAKAIKRARFLALLPFIQRV